MITARIEIKRPATRIVFPDEGQLSSNSWTVWYDQEKWWNQIAARHGDGTNLGFADEHSEYWKRIDPRTRGIAETDINQWQGSGDHSDLTFSPGNLELHKVQRRT